MYGCAPSPAQCPVGRVVNIRAVSLVTACDQDESVAMPENPDFVTTRPFLFAAARKAGISRRQLAGARFRRLHRGVYIDAKVEMTPLLWAEAALLLAGRATFISRHSAARVWGGAVPGDWRTHTTTLVQEPEDSWPSSDFRRPRVETIDSRVSSDRSRVVTYKAIRLSDPVRTFLELADELDLVELVVLGDSLVRKGRTTPEELVAAAETPGPHRRRARRAAGLVRREVDSPQESRLRMLIVLAGLPEPEVNVVFHDDSGTVRRRNDMGYRRYQLGFEFEGRQHAESLQQWREDITRREEFDDLGWRLLLFVSEDLSERPEQTLERIVGVLRRQGCSEAKVRSTEWRRYFGPRWKRTA